MIIYLYVPPEADQLHLDVVGSLDHRVGDQS